MPNKRKWENFEAWKKFGLKNRYNKRNPNSLKRSKDNHERSWYSCGSRHTWLNDFLFNRKIENNNLWNSEKEWREYGIKKGYDHQGPTELFRSKIKEERAWLDKGKRKGWANDFEFIRNGNIFKNYKIWREYGLKNGYEKINPSKLSRGGDKKAKSWYRIGLNRGWLNDFKLCLKNRRGGELKNLDYILTEVKRIITEEGWDTIPSSGNLNKQGYSSVAYAISHYHGGFPAFREKLREYLGQPYQESQLESFLLNYLGEENESI